jgi:hypothetical protein
MIKITDKYYADCDKYNWILCKKHIITESEAVKRKKVNAGDIEFINLTYHATLPQLLVSLFEKNKKSVAQYECDLEGYIKKLKFMQEDFLKNVRENFCDKK